MEKRRERTVGRPRGVPAAMAPLVRGRRWYRDLVGESGCAVFRLSASDAPDLYLKRGRGAAARDAADEAARLRWLDGRLPAPRVLACEEAAGATWLLATAVPGVTAYQAMEAADPSGRVGLARALSRFLMWVHALPAGACPFDAGYAVRLAHARVRLEAGLIDEDDFDPEREGWTARQVWDAMAALLPLAADRAVVTHGDFSLDNLLVADGTVVGCIDTGRLGVADRYQDLAILWNGLQEFGAEVATAALAEYGADPPDERRMLFHLLLDECF